MSKQTPGSHSLYCLLPTDIEGVDSLAELALDLHWSWNHATDEVWRTFDPVLELISSHIAKSSRINRQRFAQHVLHAEIGQAAQGGLRILLLKPCGGICRVMFGLQQVIDTLAEGGIGQHALKLVPRYRLQDDPRILSEFPHRHMPKNN